MQSIPHIPQTIFFAIMVALQLVDAFTTAKGLRSGRAGEANGFLRKLMKAIGVNEALFLVKAVAIYAMWKHPVDQPFVQWAMLVFYVGIAANNLRVLRKLKAIPMRAEHV